jgi:UDP:flavonoid glycosyltransferase YjiC (YdhE family)
MWTFELPCGTSRASAVQKLYRSRREGWRAGEGCLVTRERIDLLSPPFAGHLHPILGMAQALQSDYDVRVITTPTALRYVQAAGIEAVPMLAGWEKQLDAIVNTSSATASNPKRLFSQLSQAVSIHQQVGKEMRALYRASRPQLLIADFTLIAVGPVATALGILYWTSLPSPCVIEGGDGPPSYLGGLRPMDGWLGKIRDRSGWALIRSFKRLAALAFRKDLRRIGLTSVYRHDGTESVYSDKAILVLGWRELEFQTRWPASACFMPPFLYSPPINCLPPRFAEGKKHVLVTLGTHLSWIKDRVASEMAKLATLTPEIEYHFSDGDLLGEVHHEQGNFQRLSCIDYRLIARYSLVIHHAGAGVMAHCLTMGLPAVVFPVDFDQFDNAARLEHAGLAIRIRHLKSLPLAITTAIADMEMQERCRQFARTHTTEDPALKLRTKVQYAIVERAYFPIES